MISKQRFFKVTAVAALCLTGYVQAMEERQREVRLPERTVIVAEAAEQERLDWNGFADQASSWFKQHSSTSLNIS